jgi:hypothetical protein
MKIEKSDAVAGHDKKDIEKEIQRYMAQRTNMQAG